MKIKKIVKCSLATAIILGSFGAIAGCKKENNTAEKTEQEQTYDLYVQYMNARGENPLTYEQWIISIKGEKGEPGKDAIAPQVRINQASNEWEISTDNGLNWYSTNIKATGNDGHSPVITIGENSNWFVDGVDSNIKAKGEKGEPGKDAIAPQVRINQASNEWEISTDNGSNWYSTNIKATGNDGHSPVITIGENGNWFVDGVDSTIKAKGEDATYNTYSITYNYNYTGTDKIFDNFKTSQEIKSTEWITNLPTPKDSFEGTFDGWYIKGTNKKIENYDFIGGDVELEARWSYLPAGYYGDSGTLTWEEFASINDAAIQGDTIYGKTNTSSYFKNKYPGILVIDDSITTIANSAFNHSAFVKIFIPDSVTSIGKSAFYYCDDLEEIRLPKNIKSIREESFYRATNLEKINIPEGVTTIEYSAFYGCSKLKELIIPASVTSIDGNPCKNCRALEKIEIDENNTVYDSRNNSNAIIETSTNTLIAGSNYTTIPDDVVAIGSSAFLGSGISSITIPSSVRELGDYIFSDCIALYTVIINEGVTRIGNHMFKDCRSIFRITIPSSVTYIPMNAFVECEKLKSVSMENNSQWTGYLFSSASFTFKTGNEEKTAQLFLSMDDNPPYPSGYGAWVKKVNDYGFNILYAELDINTVGEDNSYIKCLIMPYHGYDNVVLNISDLTVVSNDITYNIENFTSTNDYKKYTSLPITNEMDIWINIKSEEGKPLLDENSSATIYYKGQELFKIN